MAFESILITGGAGFVGSSLAIRFKGLFPRVAVTAFDNLHRRGSELNLPRLQEAGIRFLPRRHPLPGRSGATAAISTC